MNFSTLLNPLHNIRRDGLDFARIAFNLFDEVHQLPDAGRTLRERRGDIKQLLEEVLPIARYVLAHYDAGRYITVRWVGGSKPPDASELPDTSQRFDAEMEAHGARVDQGSWPAKGILEVTTALHSNEYLMRERLNAEGSAFGLDGLTRVKKQGGYRAVDSNPTSYSNLSFIDQMADIVLTKIRAKMSKSYLENTTLIVNIELNTVYFPSEWEDLVEQVKGERLQHSFRQIFLSAEAGPHTASL